MFIKFVIYICEAKSSLSKMCVLQFFSNALIYFNDFFRVTYSRTRRNIGACTFKVDHPKAIMFLKQL